VKGGESISHTQIGLSAIVRSEGRSRLDRYRTTAEAASHSALAAPTGCRRLKSSIRNGVWTDATPGDPGYVQHSGVRPAFRSCQPQL